MSAAKRMWEDSYMNGLDRDVNNYWDERSDYWSAPTQAIAPPQKVFKYPPSYEIGYIRDGIFRQLLICNGAKNARSQVKKMSKNRSPYVDILFFRKLK